MALYVHGLYQNFAKLKSVWYHLSDGGMVFQVGIHGADCRNRNRVADRIDISQRMMEAPWVAISDCIRSGSRVHNCILDANLQVGQNESKV
jgi:hypothetical protein